MRNNCVTQISSIPFPSILKSISDKYSDEVILRYTQLYKKELSWDNVYKYLIYDGKSDNEVRFSTYSGGCYINLEKRIDFLKKVYNIEDGSTLNFELSSQDVVNLFKVYNEKLGGSLSFIDLYKFLSKEGYKVFLSPDDINNMYNLPRKFYLIDNPNKLFVENINEISKEMVFEGEDLDYSNILESRSFKVYQLVN